MFLAAAVRPFTLGMQAGELLISLSSSPHFSSNNPVICVYYRRVADGLAKSSYFQTCFGGPLSAGDRTLSLDEKTGAGKLN